MDGSGAGAQSSPSVIVSEKRCVWNRGECSITQNLVFHTPKLNAARAAKAMVSCWDVWEMCEII